MLMTTNQSRAVRAIAKTMGVTVGRVPIDSARPHVGYFISLDAPDGQRFSTGPTQMLCDDWQDALDRIKNASLEPEAD